jgi:hypothetical protein
MMWLPNSGTRVPPRPPKYLMFKRKVLLSGLVLAVSFGLGGVVYAQSSGIKGKVRTASGRAIQGATVTARLDGKDVKTMRSDEDGTFVMRGLDAGKYTVVFEAQGYSSGTLYNVEIKKNNVRDLGDRLILSVDRGTQVLVKGSVFFKEGTSVAGAKVELARINEDGTTRSLGSAYTNISGEFTFHQPEGAARFRVTASYKGVSASKDVEVDMAAVYRLALSLDLSRSDK